MNELLDYAGADGFVIKLSHKQEIVEKAREGNKKAIEKFYQESHKKKIYLKTNNGSMPFCYTEDFPKIKEKAKLLGVNFDDLTFIEA